MMDEQQLAALLREAVHDVPDSPIPLRRRRSPALRIAVAVGLVLVVAAMVALLATPTGTPDVARPPVGSGRQVDLPTQSRPFRGGLAALITGRLQLDRNGCVQLGYKHGSAGYAVWPYHWSATVADDGTLTLFDAAGRVVAHGGDQLEFGGGLVPRGPFEPSACLRGHGNVVVANPDVRVVPPPTTHRSRPSVAPWQRALLRQLEADPAVAEETIGTRHPDGIACGLGLAGSDSSSRGRRLFARVECFGTLDPGDDVLTGTGEGAVVTVTGRGADTRLVGVQFPRQAFLDADYRRLFPPSIAAQLRAGQVAVKPAEPVLQRRAEQRRGS